MLSHKATLERVGLTSLQLCLDLSEADILAALKEHDIPSLQAKRLVKRLITAANAGGCDCCMHNTLHERIDAVEVV